MSLNLLNNYRDNAALGRITDDESTNSKTAPSFSADHGKFCLKSRADPTFHRENVKSVGLSLFSLEFLLVALRGGKLPKTSLGQNG